MLPRRCSPLAPAALEPQRWAKMCGLRIGDREYWVSARTAKMLERIARAEHDLAAVTIGTLTVKFHYQTVRTCDVTKSLGP